MGLRKKIGVCFVASLFLIFCFFSEAAAIETGESSAYKIGDMVIVNVIDTDERINENGEREIVYLVPDHGVAFYFFGVQRYEDLYEIADIKTWDVGRDGELREIDVSFRVDGPNENGEYYRFMRYSPRERQEPKFYSEGCVHIVSYRDDTLVFRFIESEAELGEGFEPKYEELALPKNLLEPPSLSDPLPEPKGEDPVSTEVPSEDPVPTEVPSEDPVSTEDPGEDPVSTEDPGEDPVSTEVPGEDPVSTEVPGEDPVSTETQNNSSNMTSLTFQDRLIDLTDHPPIVRNGYTFFPFEDLIEFITLDSSWNKETRVISASLREKTFGVSLDTLDYLADGEVMDAKEELQPFINGKRTYIYIDYLAEKLGFNVTWDADKNAISLN
jgi:hypothetical protein